MRKLKFKICLLSILVLAGLQHPLQAQENFSFAFLTDLHLNEGYYANSFGGVQKAVESAKKNGVDFILTGGDNVDLDGMKAAGLEKANFFLSKYNDLIQSSGLKWHMTIGNHDRYWHSPQAKGKYGEDLFQSYFGKTYYTFDHKGWKFIVLNSTEICDENYCVSPDQVSWLQDVIKSTPVDQPIIVSTHVPFLSLYYPVLDGKYTSRDTFTNQKAVFDMFKDHNLKLVLQGHQHLYEEIKVKGVQFITAGAVSANWWDGNFHGTEEGYLKVNVDGDQFSWEYIDYGWEVQRAPTKKAIFVIVDGIPAETIERVPTPAIDSISALGGYTRAYTGGLTGTYSESPTISAVCYAHLVTGTWTHKHNIWGNGLEEPNYHYPSIFRYFKDTFPDKTIGVYSTWLDNRTKLLGENLEGTRNLKFDFSADGYEVDTVQYPHDKNGHYIHLIDERVSKETALSIREDAPDLSWVYLQYTDNAGHMFGHSLQMDSAVRMADAQVGRLWEAIQYREKNFNEDWLIYVVTDHGRDAKGFHHGGQSHPEREIWLSTNDTELNSYFKEETPALVDVLPSIARYMRVKIPRESAFELDGIPLTGDVSHQFTHAELKGDQLNLSWKAFKNRGKLKVWMATTNNFSTGGKDEYLLLGEVDLAAGIAQFDVKKYPSDFYKIVLESDYHTANRWVIKSSDK